MPLGAPQAPHKLQSPQCQPREFSKALVMLFGKSLFESVLNRIEEETPAPVVEEDVSHRIKGLSTGFVTDSMEGISVSMARIGEAYLDLEPGEGFEKPVEEPVPATEAPTPQEPEAPPPHPPHLLRIKPAEIAADLGISADDTTTSLQEKRRHFSKHNHPDVVHPTHRLAATQRMMIANLLIDEAQRRLAAMERLGMRRRR